MTNAKSSLGRLARFIRSCSFTLMVLALVGTSAASRAHAQAKIDACAPEHATVTLKRGETVRVCAQTPSKSCGVVVKVEVPANSSGAAAQVSAPDNKVACQAISAKIKALKPRFGIWSTFASAEGRGKWDNGEGEIKNPEPCALPKVQLPAGEKGKTATYQVSSVQKGTSWSCVDFHLQGSIH